MRNDTYGLNNFELYYKMGRLSDRLTNEFWNDHSGKIERFVRNNSHDPVTLNKFYDALENRVVQTVLKDLKVTKYKNLMSVLVRIKFWKLFKSKTRLLRGDLPMRRNFNHITASRLQKWAEKADIPEDREYLEKLAQSINRLSPSEQGGMNLNKIVESLAPEEALDQMTGQNVVDLSTGDQGDPANKGEFDIEREPASPMWNVELLRVKANSANEVQQIIEKFIEWARDNGQPRMSVGTIKRSRDDEDTGK